MSEYIKCTKYISGGADESCEIGEYLIANAKVNFRSMEYIERAFEKAEAAGKLAGKKELVELLEIKFKEMEGIFHEDTIGAENVLNWLKSQLSASGSKEVKK